MEVGRVGGRRGGGGLLLKIARLFCAYQSIFTHAEAFLGCCGLFLVYYVMNQSQDMMQ